MTQYIGGYDLETIKWFAPTGITVKVDCPICGKTIEMDAGDDFIEYPKKVKQGWLECCDNEIELKIGITLVTVLDVEIDPCQD